jgi:hypothetical protein
MKNSFYYSQRFKLLINLRLVLYCCLFFSTARALVLRAACATRVGRLSCGSRLHFAAASARVVSSSFAHPLTDGIHENYGNRREKNAGIETTSDWEYLEILHVSRIKCV